MSDATASAAPSVAVAARAAVDFLLAARSSSGESSHWTDFMLPAGASDLWVTAFVGGVLARSPDAEAHAAAEAAWLFLAERASAEGGWGYNTNVPADADSTLWGLRLGAALGVSECPAARRARAFLDRHRHPDGGLATYASADAVRAYLGLPQGLSFAGWTASHGCVTAAGANLPAWGESLRPALLRDQAADGSWRAYWWFDDEYATAEAVAALAGAPEHAARIDQAVDWTLRRLERLMDATASRSPSFALAHAARTLARAVDRLPLRTTLDAVLERLASTQRADGSWAASARLRVPRPDTLVPDPEAPWKPWRGLPAGPITVASVLQHTFTNYSIDHRGVYSTATVLWTLQEAGGERRAYPQGGYRCPGTVLTS